MECINSKREIFVGNDHFKNHVLPSGFNYRAHNKEKSKFFSSYGFSVSGMHGDFYRQLTGVSSDRYLSPDVYWFYVVPALQRMDFVEAYSDKNLFSRIFHGFQQPESVVKRINGHYFIGDDGREVQEKIAVAACVDVGEPCIIKPTVYTFDGRGVALLDVKESALVLSTFASYGKNFIVQKRVVQHPVMNTFNTSSVNTLRIFTYRSLNGEIHCIPNQTFLRFGGKGAVFDNAAAGGFLVGVNEDGVVEGKLKKFKSLQTTELRDVLGLDRVVIPGFEKARNFAMKLHQCLPYFDLAGWDIAISENVDPIFIEFNYVPTVEGPQMTHGPAFGEYLDEIMDRASKVKKEKKIAFINRYDDGFEYKMFVNCEG